MTEITLSKTETTILTEAAGREDGRIELPDRLKPASAMRLIGKLLKHGLIVACDYDGEAGHRLTATGYRAVGLTPRTTGAGTKPDLVVGLLGRGEGATLEELMAATGWLPPTTRATICRLRKDGHAITKGSRADGRSAYLIAPEPKARRDRSRSTDLAA